MKALFKKLFGIKPPVSEAAQRIARDIIEGMPERSYYKAMVRSPNLLTYGLPTKIRSQLEHDVQEMLDEFQWQQNGTN